MKILFRFLTLPFIIILYCFVCIRNLCYISYYHIKHGGEYIHYEEKVNPLTFADTIYRTIKENEINSDNRT
jgi:hypothetical protein